MVRWKKLCVEPFAKRKICLDFPAVEKVCNKAKELGRPLTDAEEFRIE